MEDFTYEIKYDDNFLKTQNEFWSNSHHSIRLYNFKSLEIVAMGHANIR